MQSEFSKHFPASRWLYIFLSVHLLLWTLVPILVRYNLPMDSIEGATWGHQLALGYDKNPYLNGWLTSLAVHLGGSSGWMIYLFSQLSVVICFWTVWKIANSILSPCYALISVMLLEGIQYYNLHAIDFNDNTLELSLWGLTSYYFYKALRNPTHRAWILTGLFAGLGMMAKYYTITLIAAMALLLLSKSNHRKQLLTFAPYAGLLTFLIVTTPHVVWLFSHDFITVTYVFQRAASELNWTRHFYFPLLFTWQQLQVLLPTLILFGLLFIGKKNPVSYRLKISSFNKKYLLFVGLGPFLLTLLISLTTGTNLRAGWGMPLFSLWGIILLSLAQPHLTKTKIYGFIATIFILMSAIVGGYSKSLIFSRTPSSANFPGREIATFISSQWHDAYHSKLAYVAGSRWIGGNISFYSTDHPAVFMEWNNKKAFWINMADMKEKGAVFIWDITNNEQLPAEIAKQYPNLSATTIMEFSWKRHIGQTTPIKLGVAFLPPSNQTSGTTAGTLGRFLPLS